jgi:8-amino-3,8-dideoxy-alpha-D-manno-octulosonate transaminase
MPGTELFGIEERKEVNDVLETGILFRYNHDAQRNNIWKAREFEAEVKKITGAKYAHAVSSGSTAVYLHRFGGGGVVCWCAARVCRN